MTKQLVLSELETLANDIKTTVETERKQMAEWQQRLEKAEGEEGQRPITPMVCAAPRTIYLSAELSYFQARLEAVSNYLRGGSVSRFV